MPELWGAIKDQATENLAESSPRDFAGISD
ncbi:hypothetical protein RSK20926_06937 [Roseobacter sp. SK209-2-6]|nr:hypothetical protein RSK20926_06937 [Roseobacter sp. SK209-2-6]